MNLEMGLLQILCKHFQGWCFLIFLDIVSCLELFQSNFLGDLMRINLCQ